MSRKIKRESAFPVTIELKCDPNILAQWCADFTFTDEYHDALMAHALVKTIDDSTTEQRVNWAINPARFFTQAAKTLRDSFRSKP